jgi:hypothetical protein
VIVAALLLAGCANNKGYEGGMQTATNLQGAADRIQRTQAQVDHTLALADELVNRPQPDPRPQFEKFRRSLRELESMAEDVRAKADEMRARGDQYFAQWEKDIAKIHNEDIRKVSAERRAERMEQFRGLQQSYQEVANAFRPFLADLQDIEQALSAELTSGSLAAMKPFVASAHEHKTTLRAASDELIRQFRDLGVQMSAVAPRS